MDFPALIAACLIVIIAIFKTTVIKKSAKRPASTAHISRENFECVIANFL